MRHIANGLARILVVTVVTLCLLTATAVPAGAGGWALASLDPMPAPTAGDRREVGFTILQHGVTPAADLDDVGVEIVLADGSVRFAPAFADGPPGHYVATVSFPEAGTHEWSIRMGWFGSYDLGPLEVNAATSTSSSSWPPLRLGLVAGVLVLAGVAVADAIGSRTRRRTEVAVG
jgi:hypothetical protein